MQFSINLEPGTLNAHSLKKKAKFTCDFSLKGKNQDTAGSPMHTIPEGERKKVNPEP